MVEDGFDARRLAAGVRDAWSRLSAYAAVELSFPGLAIVALAFAVAPHTHGLTLFATVTTILAIAANAAFSLVRTAAVAERVEKADAAIVQGIAAIDKASYATRGALDAVQQHVLPAFGQMLAGLDAATSDRGLSAAVRTRLMKARAPGERAQALLTELVGPAQALAAEAEPQMAEAVLESAAERQDAPAEAAAPMPAFAVAPAYQPVRPLRVLAAEANDVHQLVLRTLLAQIGVEPEIVADGAAMLEAWRREPWDLILMDMQAPEIDGANLASMIRAAEVGAGWDCTAIVALGAAGGGAYGVDAAIAKPILGASLFRAMETALAAPEALEFAEVA
jgi:CheY-like chemotaxis protein